MKDSVFGMQVTVFTLKIGIFCFTLYCAFLDYSKAFDNVVRDNLWYKLLKVGIRGKMIFRKSGKICYTWFYNENPIEIVDTFCYL